MKVKDIVKVTSNRLDTIGRIYRVRKLNAISFSVENGIVAGTYVYKESELELIDLETLNKKELIEFINTVFY